MMTSSQDLARGSATHFGTVSSACTVEDSPELDATVRRVCERIAPTWPLDRFIAVNPFWEQVDTPIAKVSEQLRARSGARLLMPRSWFREQFRQAKFSDEDLREALLEFGDSFTVEGLHSLMMGDTPETERRARVMDCADMQRDLVHQVALRDFITHSLSQFCASYFDEGQARLCPSRDGGLYASFRRHALQDRSPARLADLHDYAPLARELPEHGSDMIRLALYELGIPVNEREAYLSGLLLDLNGWAAWCAYKQWAARLAGGSEAYMSDLLAIRLAWEWILHRSFDAEARKAWQNAIASWPAIDAGARAAQTHDWVLQRALELAWQRKTSSQIASGLATSADVNRADVQAVFCIDVRSEVYRRALEAQTPKVQTLGFAGFFGMPIEYQPIASVGARPQLPGLLAARMRVTDTNVEPNVAARRTTRLEIESAWKHFKTSALSTFVFVESLGILSFAKLVADTFSTGAHSSTDSTGLTAREASLRRPRLTAHTTGALITLEERCTLACGVLQAMSLTRNFARLVVLIGHGSQTRNNPHAAGLDCGACCGQTGEVNARVAAALLNEPEVRAGLAAGGICIPEDTHFIAGMHDTTTDRVALYELDTLPASHRSDHETLRGFLDAASTQARRERAPALEIRGVSDRALLAALDQRARDWAQVRPEWGLANNAAFVVAPRAHCKHMSFDGRAFLHDYCFQDDPDFAVLELIMTAPMVVTHWINMQYYASTVDNLRYGSGNKVLHNVVGGHLGVFEGNGGDLRIGLPMQSLHDGANWVHTPMRLSVFIEAPTSAIEAVLQKHEKVRALIENDWLYMFQIDAEAGVIRALRDGNWTRF
jgi:uncharacterized protein